VLGVGGCDTCWWGGAGRRRQGRWRERRREGEAGALTGGGVARGIAGSGARQRGRHGAEETSAMLGSVRSGGAGSDGWRGQAGRARGRSVGARGSVGRLDRWVQVMELWSITLDDE
jgi:hypothetical protein